MHRVHFHKQTRTKSKYNSRSKEYNRKRYDSIKEANYAEGLDWLLKAKEIQGWERQVKIDLKVNGKHICNYYWLPRWSEKTGAYHFGKWKASSTDVFLLKWKLFEALVEEMYPELNW